MTTPVDEAAETHRQRVYDAVAAFFAGVADSGVRHVVVSPGSRSTALAVSAHRSGLRVWVHHDERSAAFFALGLAHVTRLPAVLVCTSGTAVANYLPAIVEAHHSGVPMLAVTADRPPELRQFGAGQTIDQVSIFGSNCRWFAELPVAGESGCYPDATTRWARRAVAESTGARPGPVHLNWPFREPLEPPAAPLPLAGARPAPLPLAGPRPAPLPLAGPRPANAGLLAGPRPASADQAAALVNLALGHERGVLAAGPLDAGPATVAAISRFAAAAGWPIIAEPTSSLRCPSVDGAIIATADSFLRNHDLGHHLAPDVIVRVGLSPTTKPLRLWAERERPAHVLLVDPGTDWPDPSYLSTAVIDADPASLFDAAADALGRLRLDRRSSSWVLRWHAADRAAESAIGEGLGLIEDPRVHAPAVVRALARTLPTGSALYVSNSMPVRDIDTYWPPHPAKVLANRGASGIDGLISSALGVAASGQRTVLLTGDLAFLHDFGGLLGARRLGVSLVVVVVDNDGGGIFSFLPIAAALDDGYQELFHTPHGHDLNALAEAAGAAVATVSTLSALEPALARAMEETSGPEPRVSVVHVRIDHTHDLAVHRSVQAVVSTALDRVSLPTDLTARSRMVTTAGVALHVVDRPGDRTDLTPALVIHGFTGSATAMAPLAEHLSRSGRRVLTLDLLGHGASDRPATDDAYTMPALVEQVAGVVAAEVNGPVHIIGYSLGGRLALSFAATHADMVASLSLIGASPGLADAAERAERVRSDTELADRIETDGIEWFVDTWASNPLFASQAHLGPVALAAGRQQRLASTADALARTLRGSGTGAQAPLHDRLPHLGVPVLLIVGELDTKFTTIATAMTAVLPAGQVHVTPNAGHAAHLDALDDVARTIDAFLAT